MSERSSHESGPAAAPRPSDAPKVILVTGASAGLGEACARHLARQGHRVYGTSRRVAPDAESVPGRVTQLRMDVTDEASVERAIEVVLEREGRIDVVVNNAGVGLAGSVEDTSVDEARALFETNVFGVHRVLRAVLPSMRAARSGLIVNVSSIAGIVTIPFQGFYSASKYALESLSDALRLELAPFGIAVCLVEPGDFRTGFTASRVFADALDHGSAYAERCRSAVAVMERDERAGADPELFARLVEKLVAARRPAARHPIGKLPQRVVPLLRRVTPDAFLDRIVASIYDR